MRIATYPFFTATQDAEDLEEGSRLSEMANALMVKNPNLKLYPRSVDDIIDKESTEQMSAEYIRGKIAKQGMRDGATHTMAGFLSGFTVNEREKKLPNGNTSISYEVSISFSLQLIDQTTGQAAFSKDFAAHASSGLNIAIGKSQRDATIARANKRARRYISNWLVTVLPSDFKILKIQEMDKKGLPAELIVKGGTNIGLEKGDELRVVQIEMLDGAPLETDIAELKVSEAQEQISICSVRSGKEQMKLLLDSKAELKILFKPEKED